MSQRRIASSRDAAVYFEHVFRGKRRESLHVAHLAWDLSLLHTAIYRSVATDTVSFPLRNIITTALEARAHSVVLAHNHPGGDAQPSQADISATRAFVSVAAPLGIRLVDHLIFADRDTVSLRTLGFL